jgi:glucuronoarabinoxylan endo-1,4-beta-xylanase
VRAPLSLGLLSGAVGYAALHGCGHGDPSRGIVGRCSAADADVSSGGRGETEQRASAGGAGEESGSVSRDSLVAAGIAGAAGDSATVTGSPGGATSGGAPLPVVVTVHTRAKRQTMAGFGTSDNWLRALSTDLADLAWDKDKGIGLSLHRIGINSRGENGGSWVNARNAAARGARLWASPWSPPRELKTGDSTRGDIGGTLRPAAYESWATTLADFARKTREQAGAELYAISPQNEPDYAELADYDGCSFDEVQLAAFISVLGPKLHALDPPVRLLAPETSGWDRMGRFADAIKAAAAANVQTDLFATHDYGYEVVAYPDPGRPIWQTEASHNIGIDDSMENGIEVAGWIHDALAKGNASAWHFWWINQTNPAESSEGLMRNGTPTRRFYVVGNWSKFVRPGFVRVETSSDPSDLRLSAFIGEGTMTLVVIVDQRPINLSVTIEGGMVSSLIPWTTSTSSDLRTGPGIPVTAGRFTAALEPLTVTSFVGSWEP